MKIYTQDELEQSYGKFIDAIKKTFTGERLDKLLFMYSRDELGKNLIDAPASSNVNFNNPYQGGYIDHVTSVARNAHRMYKLYESIGGSVNFTTEELMFAAFHHDLGKLGTKEHMYYIPQTSDWHIKNKGEYYIINPDLQYMDLADRALFTLNEYGIRYNSREFLGIKLANGLYVDDNVKYLKSFNANRNHDIAVSRLVHLAKEMTTLAFRQKN